MLEVMENACGGGYGQLDLASMDMHKAGKNADCYDAFCVKKKKTNCASKTAYGAKCKECPKGTNGLVCSGHGSCLGASDKLGKGGCECGDHWIGSYCHQCHEDYYEHEDACVKCHESCKTCTGPTTKECKACNAGFTPQKHSNGDFSCRRATHGEL